MTTIDNIMKLAQEYGEAKAQLEPHYTTQAVNYHVKAREALHTALTEALAAKPVREPANWYCIDKSGMATLCADEADALQNAKLAALDWPNNAPYRAVQLVEAQPVREPLTQNEIKAAYFCHEIGHVSVSLVQRKLAIGYSKAQTLCESIIKVGLVHGLERAPDLDGIGGDK